MKIEIDKLINVDGVALHPDAIQTEMALYHDVTGACITYNQAISILVERTKTLQEWESQRIDESVAMERAGLGYCDGVALKGDSC